MPVSQKQGLAVARAPEDSAGLGIDVDPDHAAILDELHPIALAVELGTELVGIRSHQWHHTLLELREGH
jgi:hypothetical protein